MKAKPSYCGCKLLHVKDFSYFVFLPFRNEAALVLFCRTEAAAAFSRCFTIYHVGVVLNKQSREIIFAIFHPLPHNERCYFFTGSPLAGRKCKNKYLFQKRSLFVRISAASFHLTFSSLYQRPLSSRAEIREPVFPFPLPYRQKPDICTDCFHDPAVPYVW